MPDWKEKYLHLARETERAIRILTEAQQTCEELYLRSEEPDPRLIVLRPSQQEDHDSPAP